MAKQAFWGIFLGIFFFGAVTAHAGIPCDRFIRGLRFVVTVDCEWGGTLARENDANLKAYQDVLEKALAIAVRHHPDAERNIFNWPGGEIPRGRRVTIVLTDKHPEIDGWSLPAEAANGTALTVPVFEHDDSLHLYVFVRLERAMFLRPGELRKDALGQTIGAFGHTLFGHVPLQLSLTNAEVKTISTVGGRERRQHREAVARAGMKFFRQVLDDSAAKLPYTDQAALYSGLREHREAFQVITGGTVMVPKAPYAIPFSAAGLTGEADAQTRHLFIDTLGSALALVSLYPPPGAWNNMFSWDPLTLKRVADIVWQIQSVHDNSRNIVAAIEFSRWATGSPVPVDQTWGGTSWGIGRPREGGGDVQLYSTVLFLRNSMFDEYGRPRPNRLALTASFLAGSVYGNIQPRLGRTIADMRADTAKPITQQTLTQADLDARLATVAWLARFAETQQFADLSPVEQGYFRAALQDNRAVRDLLDVCLKRGAAASN